MRRIIPRRRIERIAPGRYRTNLADDERALLRALPAQLDGHLGAVAGGSTEPDESLARLFPPAYRTDDEAERAYVETTRMELAAHHRAALGLLVDRADAKELNDDELEAWATALNDIRLVLGTSLGVSEDESELDPNDARYAERVCYHYLSFLLGEVIDALSEALPPPRPDDTDTLPDDPWGEPLGDLRWDGTERPQGTPPTT